MLERTVLQRVGRELQYAGMRWLYGSTFHPTSFVAQPGSYWTRCLQAAPSVEWHGCSSAYMRSSRWLGRLPSLSSFRGEPCASFAPSGRTLCGAAGGFRGQRVRLLCAPGSRSLWGWNSQEEDRSDRHMAGLLPAAYDASLLPPEPLSGFQSKSKRELHAVNVAIGANALIAAMKLGVWCFSNSSSMLAEGLHSLCDVGNQMFLRMGIMKSQRKATRAHPYGFAREKFVWSLIAAVGIFFLGAGVSWANGFSTLLAGGHEVSHLGWNATVLGISLLLEGYSLLVAVRTVLQGAQQAGVPFLQFVQRGADPTSIAVMMEDSGAVAGLLIAGACTVMVQYTGSVMWDSIGSIAVGNLLGLIAWFLISRNRNFLIGRSMSPDSERKIIEHLEQDPVVNAVYDPKTEEIGPGVFRFKAEIDFSGETVVERHMIRLGKQPLYEAMQAAARTADHKAMDRLLKEYGKEIISAVGQEVDRIEVDIQSMNPGVLFVDLETDRGGKGVKKKGSLELREGLGIL